MHSTNWLRFCCIYLPLGYRSPELIRGAAFDGAVDMWSLGVMLLELLTVHHYSLPEDLQALTYVMGYLVVC